MQQPYDKDGLTTALFSTDAISIWNNQTGPVFWYAANVPGPFYVNTEKLIGGAAAEKLLQDINVILAKDVTLAEKSELIHDTVMTEYNTNTIFQKVIATLLVKARAQFGERYNCISGGERRDWFFSIPFAHESQLDHIFLFKDQSIFTRPYRDQAQSSPKVLHVADLINNAASYFSNWLPTLKQHNLPLIGTACVITRGSAGIDKLKEANVEICALKNIDPAFFAELREINLIDKTAAEEITAYFTSKEDWAKKYILSKPHLFKMETLDSKSKERLKFFLENDPWNLRANDNEVFSKLITALNN